MEIFQKNINELDEEITALSTIREILSRFAGGLYAAHMIAFGNFNEWEQLFIWANQSEKYEFAGDMKDQEHMCGMLEEHLNYVNHVELENTEPEDFQLDLLLPLREKQP